MGFPPESCVSTHTHTHTHTHTRTWEESGLHGRDVEVCAAEEDQGRADDRLTAAAGPGLPLQTGEVATQLLHALQQLHVAPEHTHKHAHNRRRTNSLSSTVLP